MKITLTMTHLKECVNSHRYAGEKGDPVQALYILKTALKPGEKAPASIVMTVHGID